MEEQFIYTLRQAYILYHIQMFRESLGVIWEMLVQQAQQVIIILKEAGLIE